MSEGDEERGPATVQGVIAQVKPWKNGGGYFLSLVGDSNDYYGWKTCKFNEGDAVELSVKEGTGKFADKVQILSVKAQGAAKTEAAPRKSKVETSIEKSVRQGNSVYFNKDELICKQCCVKAASPITAAMICAGLLKTKKEILEADIDIADRKFCYITEQEGPDTEGEADEGRD